MDKPFVMSRLSVRRATSSNIVPSHPPLRNRSCSRALHSSPLTRSSFFNLAGLSTSRENRYLSKEHRMPRTEFSPHLELIRSSEVDPQGSPGSRSKGTSVPQAASISSPIPPSSCLDRSERVAEQIRSRQGSEARRAARDAMAAQAAKDEAEREIAALAEAKKRIVDKIMDPATGSLTLTEENGEVTKIELDSPSPRARPPPLDRRTRAKETYLLLFAVFLLGLSVPWRDASRWVKGKWVEHKIQGWETEMQARDAKMEAEKLANAKRGIIKREIVDEGIRRYREMAALEQEETKTEQAQLGIKFDEKLFGQPERRNERRERPQTWRGWFWKQDGNS